MKEKREQGVNNARIAVIFFVFLAFVVGLSLIFKIIGVIGDGKFDSEKRFNLVIANKKDTEVMSFSSSKNLAIFRLNKNINSLDTGRLLEIPIDGFIESKNLDLNQKVNSLFFKSALNYQHLKTNLTIIDLFKLYFSTMGVADGDIITKKVGYQMEGAEIDKILNRLVADELIEKDNQTIQVVNGTDIIGLGNRLARLITNMGGDVIIVATSDSPKKKSVISYMNNKTYTVKRLEKVLGYPAVQEDSNAISDISIIIGEDSIKELPF